jgi:hypothetical protein
VACKPLPPAPEELSELSTYLFRNFENEDPDVLTAGMNNLAVHFAKVDLDDDWEDLAYTVADLDEDDVADVERPDRDPELCLPVGLVAPSSHKPARHAKVIILADQTPVEPNSPNTYNRSFIEPARPDGFPGRDFELLRSDNEIVKENVLMTIPYTMRKDFRWVDLTLDDEEGQGILARSWCEDEAHAIDGDTIIHQTFSIDVFLPWGKGGREGLRYMALWSDSEVPNVGEDLLQYTLKGGMHDIFVATEAWLDEH